MRLFVAVRPPEGVLDEVAGLVAQLRVSRALSGSQPRSASDQGDGLRWASRDQWHVTLRFLGEVEDPSLVDEALRQTELAAGEATLGPKVERLGRQVLCIPVEGLDALAAAVVGATATLGQPPEDRPFRGHLTLARVVGAGRRGGRKARGQRTIRDHRLVGAPFDARWSVDEVVVVRSHLGSSGARYEDLQIHTLTRN